MNKSILLVSEKRDFSMKAVQVAMEIEGYKTFHVGFDAGEIYKAKDNADMILVSFDYIFDCMDETCFKALDCIKEISLDSNKWVYIIGKDHEIKIVSSILTANVVKRAFLRPFKVNELVAELKREVSSYMQENDKTHILVVDDSGEMLQAVRSWLSETYRVSTVNSGASAISFLAKNKPDLILLDYEMPVCPGPQLMEMIKAEFSTSSIPIMFLTGKSDAESVNKVLALKPNGYMLKSMKPDEIKKKIDNFFAKNGK